LIAEMGKLIEEGMKSGWLVATDGIPAGSVGTRVRSVRGEVSVIDGPFTETKEGIGGYAALSAESIAEAIERTRRFLKVAGDGTCELHPLYEAGAPAPTPC